MGVYLPNMEMPTRCGRCDMCVPEVDGDIDWHNVCCITGADIVDVGEKMVDCPLFPVPPHYDLIDHNALKIAVMDCDAETRIDFLKHAMDCINKAPVVIPSDMPTYEEEEGE